MTKFNVVAVVAVLALLSRPSAAFAGPRNNLHKPSPRLHRSVFDLRGGADMTSSSSLPSVVGPAADALRDALVSGPPLAGVGALYAAASLVVVPLTWYRTAYSFSVGYGLSVAAMSAALLASFGGSAGGVVTQLRSLSAPYLLGLTSLVYGLRLGAYIFVREATVESKRKQFDEMNKRSILQRTPLALMVSLLYAFMVSPVMFALRGSLDAGSVKAKVQMFFTGVAAFGTLLEAIADQHKYEAKRQSKEGEDKFVGPTTWSYKLCRHPNYFGEILHWAGLFGAGSVAFGKSIAPWACGSLGLYGILGIMFGASKGLDKKQAEKYGGQPAYDDWKGKVTSSVIPFIR